MKQYESYKDSGTPWIGQIPTHWEVKRGKFTTAILAGFAFNSDNFTTDEGYMPLIRIRDINSQTTEMNYNGAYPEAYVIRKGDILIGMDGDFNVAEWCGEDALLNQRVCKIEDTKKMSSKFAYYLLPRPLNLLNDVCYATTVKHLSTYDVMGLFLPIPPLNEQTAIAEYLDKKCGSIDKVIATQERRIEMLGELKQSIITEAVTRGINPNAPIKDSGIDWIGKIPEHWEAIPLKFTGSFGNGLTYHPEDVVESDGILVLRSSNIQDDVLDFEDTVFVKSCPEFLMVRPGDIIICSRNGSASLVGKCAMVKDEINATFGAFMMRYRPYQNPNFGFYLLQAALKMYKGLYSTTTINQLTMGVIAQIHVAIPPVAEQTAIAEYLDRKCARIDSAIAKAKREVGLLREFKQSIITEAVTGKIKVF